METFKNIITALFIVTLFAGIFVMIPICIIYFSNIFKMLSVTIGLIAFVVSMLIVTEYLNGNL